MTTEAKAKALRPIAEKLITKAKKAQEGDPAQVHKIRQIQGYLGDKEMTYKLVNDVAPRYLERPGGYLRIYKLGPARASNADGASNWSEDLLIRASGSPGASSRPGLRADTVRPWELLAWSWRTTARVPRFRFQRRGRHGPGVPGPRRSSG
ncbi:MAG: bL17 family ribosomal protein [Ilumatobacteraceae bacterium]